MLPGGRKSGPEGPEKERAGLWVSLEGGAEPGIKIQLGKNPQSCGERAGLREARGGAANVVWDGKATRRREGVAQGGSGVWGGSQCIAVKRRYLHCQRQTTWLQVVDWKTLSKYTAH